MIALISLFGKKIMYSSPYISIDTNVCICSCAKWVANQNIRTIEACRVSQKLEKRDGDRMDIIKRPDLKFFSPIIYDSHF